MGLVTVRAGDRIVLGTGDHQHLEEPVAIQAAKFIDGHGGGSLVSLVAPAASSAGRKKKYP
jgi:hypothetical protein